MYYIAYVITKTFIFALCDFFYYIGIYCIPIFMNSLVSLNTCNYNNLSKNAFIGIQVLCDLKTAEDIFETFKFISLPCIKTICLYTIGNINYFVIYNDNMKLANKYINYVHKISRLKYENIKFHITNHQNSPYIYEYFWIYMIFITSLLMFFKHRNYQHSSKSVLSSLYSLIIALGSIMLYIEHMSYKYNLLRMQYLNQHIEDVIYIGSYIALIYLIDTLLLLLNIRNTKIHDKN
jgi:hypothetical protein